MFSQALKSVPTNFDLPMAGLDRPVQVRRSNRARRMTLRVSHTQRSVQLTVPKRTHAFQADAFITKHIDWLQEQIDDIPRPRPFLDQAEIMFRGRLCTLVFTGNEAVKRNKIRLVEEENSATIYVEGAEDKAPKLLLAWLKKQARIQLQERSEFHAHNLGVSFKRLAVRDQTSRWGSCSTTGTLSFSWRLILAPDCVLDYVAAHEVSHIREMNHSANFWALVLETMPDMEKGRSWLSNKGTILHSYGAEL